MRPGNPPPRSRGNLRVATRERGTGGGGGAVGLIGLTGVNGANAPPSDPVPARQVTFQVTYGVGWGGNRANRGVGGEGGPGAP